MQLCLFDEVTVNLLILSKTESEQLQIWFFRNQSRQSAKFMCDPKLVTSSWLSICPFHSDKKKNREAATSLTDSWGF